MKTGRLALLLFLVLAKTLRASAQETILPPVGSPGDPRVKAVQLVGAPYGDQLKLTITPGPAATKAIRIYSAPSGLLLAIVIDSAFADAAEGQSWLQRYRKEAPASVLAVSLPTEGAEAIVPSRPPDDDRIVVYVNGSWPDGTMKDRLMADGTVGNGDFAFTTYALPGEDPTWCCNNQYCSNNCADCPGPSFTCCQQQGCCWIKCGTVIGGCAPGSSSGCVP